MEALLEAGRAAVLHRGRDTTLQGAQVSAETIKAQVGRDLLIRSEQDSDHYDSKQQSMSAGVTIPIYGGGGGASFSFSRDRVNSNFDSVQEQSGLFAGRGGFGTGGDEPERLLIRDDLCGGERRHAVNY
ncbi:hemagglutinin repeat-containing protein [Dickeya oryzae]|uniref:hemagglutinin repeat-containing protein n=1 Tax=Dickeya oryzae TaxID=1240404 RepID=UPI00209716C9|nr:hemagglutinin repeat-containing protein [Dickeya oryzae]MCO7256545.1 hemagglutinin repeat-containing protein [Dickeya oryzae]